MTKESRRGQTPPPNLPPWDWASRGGPSKCRPAIVGTNATLVVRVALSGPAAEMLPAYERGDGPLTASELGVVHRIAKKALPEGAVLNVKTLF